MVKPSNLAIGVTLLGCALAAWTLAITQWALTGRVALVALFTATAFSVLLVAWPFAAQSPVVTAAPPRDCHQCGALSPPGFRFCLQCGAYPKIRPRAA